MSDETVVLPASAVKAPRLPLVPLLGGAALAAAATALFLFMQVNDARSALADSNGRAATLEASLSRSEKKVAALTQQLLARQTELDSVVQAKLPLEVSFSVGAPGAGFIAHFENRSAKRLDLVIEPRRPRSGEYGKFDLSLEAQSGGDLTDKDGWEFRSGDLIAVSSGDFRPMSLQVP
jgi:hypothetical protein